jgi:hypothetical protein
VTSDFFVSERIALQLGAGYVFSGALEVGARRYDVEAGALVLVGASWRVVNDEGAIPYVVFSASLGAMRASLHDLRDADQPSSASYVAIDGRFGATLGKTFADIVSPYIALRVFGGPVFYDDDVEVRVGTDRYHVQPALGVVGIVPGVLDVFFEGAPVLEQAISGGVGLTW